MSTFSYPKPQDSHGLALWQTTVLWQREIKAILKPFSITHSQFVIMAILLWYYEKNISVQQNMIADLSKLDKMNISKSLKQLEAQKYVKRNTSEIDPRTKTIRLTEMGNKLISQILPKIEAMDRAFFNTLSPKKQHSLLECLNQLVELQSNVSID